MRVSLNRRERLGMVALALALAAYAVAVLVHRPLTTGLGEARERLAAVRSELALSEAELARQGDLDQRAMDVQMREEAIADLVPGRHSASLFVHYLSRAEAAAGVTVRSLKAKDLKPAGELLQLDLELKATGSFLSHVLFHQNLESVPLFFRIPAYTLDRQRDKVLEQAFKLAAAGQAHRAMTDLEGHPDLLGTYQVTVFFRPQRAEPGTDGLGYGAAGRIDPFAEDLVSEFLAELQRRLAEQAGAPAGTEAMPSAPSAPGAGPDDADLPPPAPGPAPPAQLG